MLHLMKSLLLFWTILLFHGCEKYKSNKEIQINIPDEIVKINKKVLIYVPSKKIELKKKIKSSSCNSSDLNLSIEKPYRTALLRLFNKMFDDFSITNKKIVNTEIYENYYSYIEVIPSDVYSIFYTENKIGKFFSKFSLSLVVQNNSKKFENRILEENSWKKNVYFDCDLSKGANISIQIGIDKALSKLHLFLFNSLKKL